MKKTSMNISASAKVVHVQNFIKLREMIWTHLQHNNRFTFRFLTWRLVCILIDEKEVQFGKFQKIMA